MPLLKDPHDFNVSDAETKVLAKVDWEVGGLALKLLPETFAALVCHNEIYSTLACW